MENNQFEQLMQELLQSRQEIDGKLTAFKWEVHIAQEKTTKELARKFNVGSSGKRARNALIHQWRNPLTQPRRCLRGWPVLLLTAKTRSH